MPDDFRTCHLQKEYNKLKMKLGKLDYLVKLTYDKAYKGYVADVINLYGCMSQGKTKQEALENVGKAIKAYMEAIDLHTNKDSEFTKKSIDFPSLVINA